MKRCSARLAASLSMMALVFLVNVPVRQVSLLGVSTAKAQPLNPCAAPNEISSNIAETAWQLWVAATCPVNQDQYPFVVWENWIEQAQMYPPDPTKGLVVPNAEAASTGAVHHLLHSSPLALTRNPKLGMKVKGLLGEPTRIATWRPLRPQPTQAGHL